MANRIKDIKIFWFLIIFGVLVRLFLAGISSWNYDMRVWYELARQVNDNISIYAYKSFSYPIGAALVLMPSIKFLTHFFSPDLWGYLDPALEVASVKTWLYTPLITSPVFNFIIKVPLFLMEGVLMYALYQYFQDKVDKTSLLRGILAFYLNPLVVFISAVHAQLDIYPVLLCLISYFLLVDKKYFFAGLLLSCAVLIKLYPLFLLIPCLSIILCLKSNRANRKIGFLTYIIGFLVPIFALAVYWFRHPEMYVSVFSRFKTIGLEGSLNILNIIYIPPVGRYFIEHAQAVSLATNVSLVILLVGIYIFFSIKVSSIQKNQLDKLYFLNNVLILAVVLLFSSRTNPNYVLWVLPSVIVLYYLKFFNMLYYWILSFSALLFYLAIHSLAWRALFLPAAGYFHWFSVGDITNEINLFFGFKGLINQYLLPDLFLLSGMIFLVTIIILCAKIIIKLNK